MAENILDNLIMKRESKSYVDSLHAILTHTGQFQGSKVVLAGYTGMAFKLSVHRRLLPMSVTAYGQWGKRIVPESITWGYSRSGMGDVHVIPRLVITNRMQ